MAAGQPAGAALVKEVDIFNEQTEERDDDLQDKQKRGSYFRENVCQVKKVNSVFSDRVWLILLIISCSCSWINYSFCRLTYKTSSLGGLKHRFDETFMVMNLS